MQTQNNIAPISNTKKLEFKHIITEDEIREFLHEDLLYRDLNGKVYYIYVDLNSNDGVKICSEVLDFITTWNGYWNGFGYNVFINCNNSCHIDGFISEIKDRYEDCSIEYLKEAFKEEFENYLHYEVGRIASEIMEKTIQLYGKSAVEFSEKCYLED